MSLVPLEDVDDPMSPAESARVVEVAALESQAHREALLRDAIGAAEVATLTGRSRQAIERLRRADRLLALQAGKQWRYPKWQFEPEAVGGILPGIEEVLQNLHLSPVGAAHWLLHPRERIGGLAPIELLRRHHPEPVIELAREQSLMP